MKETLKGILKNTIDEKKYIFKYPIISYRYYDQAKFLYISDEEIGKEYNVDEDIVRYNNDDSKKYKKKIYIVGGLFQKEKKEMLFLAVQWFNLQWQMFNKKQKRRK